MLHLQGMSRVLSLQNVVGLLSQRCPILVNYPTPAVCIVLLKHEVGSYLFKKKKKKENPGWEGGARALLHWADPIHRGCSSGHASLRSLLILQERRKKDHFAVQMLSNTSNQWKKWHNEQTSMWKQFMKE